MMQENKGFQKNFFEMKNFFHFRLGRKNFSGYPYFPWAVRPLGGSPKKFFGFGDPYFPPLKNFFGLEALIFQDTSRCDWLPA